MASGNVVGSILQSLPTAANRANPGILAGGSTPAENWPVLRFDASTDEFWDFLCTLEQYSNGGLTIEMPWAASSATSGAVVWTAAIRALPGDSEDLTASHTYVPNSVTDTAPGTLATLSYPRITFTHGADMDNLQNNSRFMLRVSRDADNGSDDMSGDAELIWPAIVIRET